MSKLRTLAVLLVVPALTLASCSSDKADTSAGNKTTTSAAAPSPTGTTIDLAGKKRPDGPAAEVVKELSGGQGPALSDLSPPDLKGNGFVEHEFEVKGNAVSYSADGDLPADGSWKLTEDANADYRTRVVVRRPRSAGRSEPGPPAPPPTPRYSVTSNPKQCWLRASLRARSCSPPTRTASSPSPRRTTGS